VVSCAVDASQTQRERVGAPHATGARVLTVARGDRVPLVNGRSRAVMKADGSSVFVVNVSRVPVSRQWRYTEHYGRALVL
jgi:hypothetical protein